MGTNKLVEIDHVTDTNVGKLIELLKDTHGNAAWHHWGYEEIADYLIANGVTLEDSKPVNFDHVTDKNVVK